MRPCGAGCGSTRASRRRGSGCGRTRRTKALLIIDDVRCGITRHTWSAMQNRWRRQVRVTVPNAIGVALQRAAAARGGVGGAPPAEPPAPIAAAAAPEPPRPAAAEPPVARSSGAPAPVERRRAGAARAGQPAAAPPPSGGSQHRRSRFFARRSVSGRRVADRQLGTPSGRLAAGGTASSRAAGRGPDGGMSEQVKEEIIEECEDIPFSIIEDSEEIRLSKRPKQVPRVDTSGPARAALQVAHHERQPGIGALAWELAVSAGGPPECARPKVAHAECARPAAPAAVESLAARGDVAWQSLAGQMYKGMPQWIAGEQRVGVEICIADV
mmetsp:Transcript_27705/g.89130  ORF Transcript_27705/g.89130 Transcript_27705/m.89130 type:complete len:327 (-) Transcript_27705:23-1003(-)